MSTRFVEEMIYGLCASGSVLLSQVARSLEEPIELHATHKRLSANLDKLELSEEISREVLSQGAKRIREEPLLIVDPSDITKKYAKKMCSTWPKCATRVTRNWARATGCAR